MKLVLAANTMENPGFPDFLHDAALAYPDAGFVVCGDLLNVFPEPGEDLRASIFYELYGDMIVDEMHRLHATHFADIGASRFVGPLRELFCKDGSNFLRGRALASRRYGRVFGEIRATLRNQHLYLIPGNMDYPKLTELFAAACPSIHNLDGSTLEEGGIVIGGVGGIPNTAQPFGAITPISPYEMSPEVYAAQLQKVWGCDVLITHLAPEECPALEAFVHDSPLRVLVCRAPFNFRRQDNCRGMSEVAHLGSKMVLKIRPFEPSENATFVLDVEPNSTDEPHVEIYNWRSPAPHQDAPQISA